MAKMDKNQDKELKQIPRNFELKDIRTARDLERSVVKTVELQNKAVAQKIQESLESGEPLPYKEFEALLKGIDQLRKSGLCFIEREPSEDIPTITLNPINISDLTSNSKKAMGG